MEIEIHKSRRTSQKNIVFVIMDKDEALILIQSLTNQMVSSIPNSGRLEQHAADGTYFSVAVKK